MSVWGLSGLTLKRALVTMSMIVTFSGGSPMVEATVSTALSATRRKLTPGARRTIATARGSDSLSLTRNGERGGLLAVTSASRTPCMPASARAACCWRRMRRAAARSSALLVIESRKLLSSPPDMLTPSRLSALRARELSPRSTITL